MKHQRILFGIWVVALHTSLCAAPIELTFDEPNTLAIYEKAHSIKFGDQTAVNKENGTLTCTHKQVTGPIQITFSTYITSRFEFDFTPDINYGKGNRFKYEYLKESEWVWSEVERLSTAGRQSYDFTGKIVRSITIGGESREHYQMDNISFIAYSAEKPKIAQEDEEMIGGLVSSLGHRSFKRRDEAEGELSRLKSSHLLYLEYLLKLEKEQGKDAEIIFRLKRVLGHQ